MLSHFFIDRPIFATVLSVAAILMLLCLFSALRTRIRALRRPSQ